MPASTDSREAPRSPPFRVVDGLSRLLARFPMSITQLALRFALAVPFWRSGLTKWDGFFRLSDTAVYLFTEEFRLHLFGGEFELPAPHIMPFLSSFAAILFPIMLVLALGTRFPPFGILALPPITQ